MFHTPGQDIGKAGDPLAALVLALDFARDLAVTTGQVPLTNDVYRALEELVYAVRADLITTKEASDG